ncbi:hypothetical protein GGR56DRAFT_656420 [Xylariaceae sp. FL0804]|nr:hypothetical protein GGR56DRAFT_656420 [Xylariaceae sp. FL0804]
MSGTHERQRPHDDGPKTMDHSGRLVYARPQDLPSYPSVGLSERGSAASAAATLGWANKKSPEPWKPDKSSSAFAAAVMAKDYKPAPTWQPVASGHGAKAALLAAQSQSSKSMGSERPAPTSHGHSAANIAFKSERNAPPRPQSNNLASERSLLAAKGAMSNRQRSGSAPVPREAHTQESSAAAHALTAATRAHRPPRNSVPEEDAGAVPYTTLPRQMFSSHPPVKAETDEQKRADVLHASALAMAKKMYNQQQKMIDARKTRLQARSSQEQLEASSTISDDAQPVQITNLQDAAYKQAQARLAKMQEGNAKNQSYQEYYGTKPGARRFSVSRKLRRRSGSDGAVIEDRKRSQQIKQQMSMFSNKLSEVDETKRTRDQEALMAAARRNVHMRLKGMDEKISAETGMMPPSTLTQWETKAHAAAQDRSHARIGQAEADNKVDIGAGRYMDQQEIDAIAARRVQPVLDEINEKVEKEQARQTELRLEMERKKEQEEIDRSHQKEIQEINRKLRDQDRQEMKERKAEEKQEAKAKKDHDKAIKAEQKRLSRAEKHKRTSSYPDTDPEEAEESANRLTWNSMGQPVRLPQGETLAGSIKSAEGEPPEEQSVMPGERSPPGKVRTWFKSRFSRGAKSPDEHKAGGRSARRSFVGGAALTGTDRNESSTSLDGRSASVRAVAMAGRNHRRAVSENRPPRGGDPALVSPLSSESEDEFFRDEGRSQSQIEDPLEPPRPIRDYSPSKKSRSPVRDSRFHEII